MQIPLLILLALMSWSARSSILVDFGPTEAPVAPLFSERDGSVRLLGDLQGIAAGPDSLRDDGFAGAEAIELSLSRGFWRIGFWLDEPLGSPDLIPAIGRKVSDEFTLHWYDDVQGLSDWINTHYLNGPRNDLHQWHETQQKPDAVFNIYSTGQPTRLLLNDLDGGPLFIAGLIAAPDESLFDNLVEKTLVPLTHDVGQDNSTVFQPWNDSVGYQVANEWSFYELAALDQRRHLSVAAEGADIRLFYRQPLWRLDDQTLQPTRDRLLASQGTIPADARWC